MKTIRYWSYDKYGIIDEFTKPLGKEYYLDGETEDYWLLVHNYGSGGALIKAYKTPQAASKAGINALLQKLRDLTRNLNEFIQVN